MSDSGSRPGRAAARDRGLRRVAHVKRWLVASAVGLTAALSAVAAQALPGASHRQAPPARHASVPSGPMAPDPTSDDPAASDPTAGDPAASAPIQPPPEPPVPAPADQSSGAVSGGS